MAKAATADVIVRSRKKGEKIYGELEQRLDRLKSRVKMLGLVAGAAAVGGLTALTIASFKSADALAKKAEKIGITTTRLAALNHLAVKAGGSVKGMQEALTKATKRLGEFNATGGGAAGIWLKRLNLDTQELASLHPDELFLRYGEAIRGLNSRGQQLAAISALMGDESRELIGLVDQGAAAFDAAVDEVTRYGIALDGIDSAKIEAANDAIFDVQQRFKGIGNVIASKVSPFVTDLANRFLDAGVEADVLGTKIDRILDGIAVGVGMVLDSFRGLDLIFGKVESSASSFGASYLETMADINDALSNAGNWMRKIFGGEQLAIDPTIRQTAIEMRGTADAAASIAANLADAERPSIALGRAIAQVRIDAVAAAQAVATARDKLLEIDVPTFDESPKDVAARERAEVAAQRLKDQLASKLAILEQALRTEEEREMFSFERREEIIFNALEQGIVTKQRALEIEADLQQQHEDKLNKIVQKGLSEREKFEQLSGKNKAKTILGFLEQQTAGVANSNQVMFRLNQAAAIGNAIVNISEGITKAWSFGPILGPPLAAIVAAAGAAQIAAIASASPGGGTTPSAAGSTPTFNNQPLIPLGQPIADQNGVTQPAIQITIIVEGSMIGDEGIKQILGDTIGELVDADVILIPPESRQAQEIRNGTGSGG